jgi:hypothetical protein
MRNFSDMENTSPLASAFASGARAGTKGRKNREKREAEKAEESTAAETANPASGAYPKMAEGGEVRSYESYFEPAMAMGGEVKGYAMGGEVMGYAEGGPVAGMMGIPEMEGPEVAQGAGPVSGPGGPKDDVIPAKLSDGEYIIPAEVVARKGTEFFDNLIAKVQEELAVREEGAEHTQTGTAIPPPGAM